LIKITGHIPLPDGNLILAIKRYSRSPSVSVEPNNSSLSILPEIYSKSFIVSSNIEYGSETLCLSVVIFRILSSIENCSDLYN